jgi:hypothetical protein
MNLCSNISNKLENAACGEAPKRKSPFTVLHNGEDGASVVNLKGDDVTEYFNITFHYGIVQVDWKKAPSFDEWRKIAGKI